MTNLTDADRLMTLLEAALELSDEAGNTLISAMLAECIDAAERDAAPRRVSR